ncbi:MAG: 6-phosphogluconolactonase [Bacteroidota bacterium]
MPTNFHIAPDGPNVARDFADFLVQRIAEKEGPFTLALSGGSTPKLLFKLLATEYQDKIDWKKLHCFWGDERCVPHTDPESNYGVTKELLLDHVAIPSENIHPVATNLAPEEAAKEYAEVIGQCVAKNATGRVVFDLIMLGMGGDGHTASIFPHQMELLEGSATTALATHPESGQIRVTLTGPVINNAREVAFLVTGNGKTARTAQILNQEVGYEKFPAAHIQPSNGELHWFLDVAAAAKVQ